MLVKGTIPHHPADKNFYKKNKNNYIKNKKNNSIFTEKFIYLKIFN
jgi:hypothetical protein